MLVSHDRSLLRATCDRFLLVADGGAPAFDGDLDDYRDWLNQQRIQQAATNANPDKAVRRQQRELDAAGRQALLTKRRPLMKELEQIEKKLAGWQSDKKILDERLADAALYEASQRALLQDYLKRQGELAHSIEAAEERWLELHEALEELPSP